MIISFPIAAGIAYAILRRRRPHQANGWKAIWTGAAVALWISLAGTAANYSQLQRLQETGLYTALDTQTVAQLALVLLVAAIAASVIAWRVQRGIPVPPRYADFEERSAMTDLVDPLHTRT
jgi:hypothetical protein